jgi:hypothetical protein
MAADSITLDDLLAAFAEAGVTDAAHDGKTLGELSAAWRCSRTIALRYVAQAKQLGKLRVGRAPRERLDGMVVPVPVYSFIVDKPAKARRRGK